MGKENEVSVIFNCTYVLRLRNMPGQTVFRDSNPVKILAHKLTAQKAVNNVLSLGLPCFKDAVTRKRAPPPPPDLQIRLC